MAALFFSAPANCAERAFDEVVDELALGADRRTIVLERKLRIAGPVQRGRRQRALRIGACEGLEARHRGGVVAALELIKRRVVGALLGDDVGCSSEASLRCSR